MTSILASLKCIRLATKYTGLTCDNEGQIIEDLIDTGRNFSYKKRKQKGRAGKMCHMSVSENLL